MIKYYFFSFQRSFLTITVACLIGFIFSGCESEGSLEEETCSFDVRCVDNIVQKCSNGVLYTWDDCGAQGMSCVFIQGEAVCKEENSEEDCIPNCKNRACGSDGCGGKCGSCPTEDGEKERYCLALVSGSSYCAGTGQNSDEIALTVWTEDACESGCSINPSEYEVWDKETEASVEGSVTWEVNDVCLPIKEKDFFGEKCDVCLRKEIGRWKIQCDGTVLDLDSGHIWQRGAAEISTVPNPDVYCDSLELAGHTDWRFPTIEETRTLVTNCDQLEPGGLCDIDGSCESAYNSPEEGYNECSCGYGEEYYNSDVWFQAAYSPFVTADNCYNSTNSETEKWCLDFTTGSVITCSGQFSLQLRCVRP